MTPLEELQNDTPERRSAWRAAKNAGGSAPSVSFIHSGGERMASYRYRAAIPARELGAAMNDMTADTLIFSKPMPHERVTALAAQDAGKTVIADFCDMHFERKHYVDFLNLADAVTCCTPFLAQFLKEDYGIDAAWIPDPYEYPQEPPHCAGDKLLWFGIASNYYSLERWLPSLTGHPLTIVSNMEGAIPWSPETMLTELSKADIVIVPETAPYKSCNRVLEAIRQGCFVVAEPHPSLEGFEGIWQGDIKKGIEWAQANLAESNSMTAKAQAYIESRYAPRTLASAWKAVIRKARSCSILAADGFTGTDG